MVCWILGLIALTAPAHASEAYLPYVGRLADVNGTPINGEVDTRVTLYADASSEVVLWQTTYDDVPFTDGYFELSLTGDDLQDRSLDVALASDSLWVGVAVDGGQDLGPTKRLATTGFIRLTDVDETCTSSLSGVMRYRDGGVQFCDAEAWRSVYEPPFATGGVVNSLGDETVHTFTSDGTFTALRSGTVQVLIVGGGGAGGSSLTGGGGGGAVLYHPALEISAQSYPITIGAGGVGVANTGVAGGNGGASSAFGVTAPGGAGAVGRYTVNPPTGQANGGGGASDRRTNQGLGVAPSPGAGWVVHAGNDGGVGGGSSPNYPGGGGAGAGGNGQSPSSSSAAGGDGGDGVLYDISGTGLYWAGGGGGSSYTGSNGGGDGGLGGGGGGSANAGAGGTGGGSALNSGQNGVSGNGNASAAQPGGDAGANTGGGGGGGNHEPGRGGNGGSGIVIIRY